MNYQERYLKHQERKAKSLTSNYGSDKFKKYTDKEREIFFSIIKNRSSQRAFNNEEINIDQILDAIKTSPSSCDRKGVYVRVIEHRHDKEILSGLLVGGVGWVNRASKILLILADKDCYIGPADTFMPYLDTGVIIQTTYLAAEAMNVGCCYVNPNIREENQEFFRQRFNIPNNEIFCGALALGKYNLKHSK